MAEGSSPAFINARPTLRFNGAENARASELIQALKIEEGEGGLTSLELRLGNWSSFANGGAGFALDGDALIKLGAPIEVYTGDATRPRELFRGKISALEGRYSQGAAPELVVLAEDALAGARQQRRSRVFDAATPADVARAIAGDLGLEPVIAGLDAPSATWAQCNETDLAFLRRLLLRFDADVQVVAAALHVSPREDVRRGELELQFGTSLHAARVTADLAHQVTAIGARGWDAAAGSAVSAEISSGSHLGPGSGVLGSDVLRDGFGERREHLGQVAARSDVEVQAIAQAAFDARARRFVCVDGLAEGNAELRVGSHVRLTGLEPRFVNTYYVTATCHRYDLRDGYRTEFRAECARAAG